MSVNLHRSGAFSTNGCSAASPGKPSSSANSEVSPRTGARRLKYLKETGRPLLQRNRQSQPSPTDRSISTFVSTCGCGSSACTSSSASSCATGTAPPSWGSPGCSSSRRFRRRCGCCARRSSGCAAPRPPPTPPPGPPSPAPSTPGSRPRLRLWMQTQAQVKKKLGRQCSLERAAVSAN